MRSKAATAQPLRRSPRRGPAASAATAEPPKRVAKSPVSGAATKKARKVATAAPGGKDLLPLGCSPDLVIESGKSFRAAKPLLHAFLSAAKLGELYSIQVPMRLTSELRDETEAVLGSFPEVVFDHLIIRAGLSGTKDEVADFFKAALRAIPAVSYVGAESMFRLTDGAERHSNVSAWYTKPTQPQRQSPLANLCPMSDVFIEIYWHTEARDYNRAHNKIANHIIPLYGAAITVIVIGLPNPRPAAYAATVGANAHGVTAAAPLLAAMPALGAPIAAPYIGWWTPGQAYAAGSAASIQRGFHVDIALPPTPGGAAAPQLRVQFDDIIDAIV